MDNRRNEPNLKLINMEQVETEKIDWLLYPFIPFGKVTIVQGDPGEGKTTMVLQIIAKLTKGEAVLPSGSDEPALEEKTMALEPVNVIYQTAEDGLGDTIKPRFFSAGADCSRVMVIDDNDQALTMMDVLIISSSYGLDPWTMLETVMLDDEYEVYMDELAADNKYLFHIFYDQPLIRLPQNANIDAEILFALSYINSCHALCKKGLKKTLIYHDENLTAKIRGKIDVSKNIKHNTARGRSDKFYCSYVDFTDDNIENRIVKAALLKSKKILKEKFSSEASVNGKINFCLNSLRHVKVTNISNTDINSSNVGGLYSYYKPAIQQARAILSLNFQSHNEKNGENEKGFVYTIPYTINMETLFEYYARTELKKALKGSEYRVEQYSKKLYLQKDIDNVDDAEKGIHLMSFCIPDIIIYKEDKPVVVIDAKYKLSGRPDRSDSHQLLSYVLLTGADRCGFVLPGEKTEVKEMVSTGDNYLPLAPRILRYYELLLGSKSDSSELQKVLQ